MEKILYIIRKYYTVCDSLSSSVRDFAIIFKHVEFEIHHFRLARQNTDETTDAYHARLRTLAKYCDLPNIDAEIKSHIIQTCSSTRLRRRALTDSDMTL